MNEIKETFLWPLRRDSFQLNLSHKTVSDFESNLELRSMEEQQRTGLNLSREITKSIKFNNVFIFY